MASHTIVPGSAKFSSGAKLEGLVKAGPSAIWLNPDEVRQTQYYVYVHSVSKRSFEQPHGMYRNVIIPACPKDKRYITVLKLAHPVQYPVHDPDKSNDPTQLKVENAIRVALSIINPDYPPVPDLTLQEKELPVESQLSGGCDLARQGVFVSLNEVPTEEELQKAEARRLAYYKKIFGHANELFRTDPKALSQMLTIDHHMAADLFGQDTGWHNAVTPKIECPNCGEKIKEGIAFHFSNGTRCILDWKRAYLAGAVKKADVPPAHRWQGFGKVEDEE